ncbi:unnamed protein product [Diatraea saccharalis]|uniref:Uncharacterized protein n=1 Tax=Diatraea saccharalis TaxID=40085 RepID=A0A9N9R5Y1_9NEOP|nr:unnamed protein product [Diatraea saccharalis]
MEQAKQSVYDIMTLFNERMSAFEAELRKTPPTTTSSAIEVEFRSFKSFIVEVLNNLQRQLEVLAHNGDRLEMRSRRKMVLLHGVPESESEDTAQIVVQVVNNKFNHSTFKLSDIKRCQRMGQSAGAHKPRPIIVKFHYVMLRDKLWFDKTKLKGTGITLSEFLTRTRHVTFMAARERFGLNKCWTREGYIYILGSNNSKHRISTMSELLKIEQALSKPAAVIPKLLPKARRVATKK